MSHWRPLTNEEEARRIRAKAQLVDELLRPYRLPAEDDVNVFEHLRFLFYEGVYGGPDDPPRLARLGGLCAGDLLRAVDSVRWGAARVEAVLPGTEVYTLNHTTFLEPVVLAWLHEYCPPENFDEPPDLADMVRSAVDSLQAWIRAHTPRAPSAAGKSQTARDAVPLVWRPRSWSPVWNCAFELA